MKTIGTAILAGVAGCLVTLLVMHGNRDAFAARPEQVKEVRTEKLVLVTATGAVKAVLGTDKDGRPVLAMVDTKEKVRFSLAITGDDSPALSMTDGKERVLIGLAVTAKDDGAVTLMDNKGKVQAALSIEGGTGKLRLNGKER
ncbi:MAG: hypothetical protein HY896_08535 [Deltaproteobacteria bacterium]|nr:hypothetical protein [Deltaproteobacteria bacterium]